MERIKMFRIDYSLRKQALTGRDDECGDSGIMIINDEKCFFAHIDALGHGKIAHQTAAAAEEYLHENHGEDLSDIIRGLHERLTGTVGVVAAMCRIDLKNGNTEYVGIGNINSRIYGRIVHKFVPVDGVIGYLKTSPRKQIITIYPGDILVMTSDGVREHFIPEEYPGLFLGSAEKISNNIIENLGKDDDDVSCTVLRYLL